jgi:hypothetical protein
LIYDVVIAGAGPVAPNACKPLGGRITYVASDAKDRLGLSGVLVRPDGFVAWAGEATQTLRKLRGPRRDGSANPHANFERSGAR